MKLSSFAMVGKVLLLFFLTQLTLLAFSDTLPDNLLFTTEAGSGILQNSGRSLLENKPQIQKFYVDVTNE